MTALAWLIPCALFLGLVGLAAFLWSLKSGQFEDLEGAGWRAMQDDEPGRPSSDPREDRERARDRDRRAKSRDR
jgi:cbb3-type cytochrome oxidase maturation protein